jgi:hypothetical protein
MSTLGLSGEYDITAGEVQINDFLSVSVVGSLSGSTEEFGTNKIIDRGTGVYLGPAAITGAFTRGVPGDIQGNSINDFAFPSVDPNTNHGSFQFAPDLTTAQFTTQQTSYSFAQPGLDSVVDGQYLKFPAVIGSTLYTYSNGQLVGTDSQPGALLVSLYTTKPFNLSRRVDLVCPEIESINCAGCFKCLEGSQLLISARSTCNSGPANIAIYSDQNLTLFTYSIMLNLSFSPLIIQLGSFDKYVLGHLRLFSGSKEATHDFQCTFDSPPGLDDRNESFPHGWVSVSSSPIDWFNNLTGPWQIIKWVVIAIIITIVVMALIVAGYFIYMKTNLLSFLKPVSNNQYETVDIDDVSEEI